MDLDASNSHATHLISFADRCRTCMSSVFSNFHIYYRLKQRTLDV